ncbi:hypothetical protein [Klebsiella phage 05F01]|nr:hypothetical protein [Klebsiella phage 05F01]HBT8980407.1 hypothetical protein [Klebsiella pneumoniae]
MVRVERPLDVWPRQVRLYAAEGNFGRQEVFAYCYPDYDDQIRLKLNSCGLGFSLTLQDAKNLRDVLDYAIKEME